MALKKWKFTRTDAKDFIERSIILGLIFSNDYVKLIRPDWNDEYLEAPYYKTVPDRVIEHLYIDALNKGELQKAEAEFIEQILLRVSEDYEREPPLAQYLYDKTVAYFKECEFRLHAEEVDLLKSEHRDR